MIKTILLFTYVGATMVFLIPLGIIIVLLGLLGFRKPMTALLRNLETGWGRVLISLVGCKVTVSGRENIPREGGVCFVSNHGSIFDIVLLLAYSGRVIGFVAKKELMFIPFLNLWILLLGGQFIDRENPRQAIKIFNKGVETIKAGGTMIIFPEGHRSRGQGLLPFHPGSLKLATQAEAVIVPVALDGTYEIFEKNNRVIASPVKITFCKPINTLDIPAADRKQVLSDQIYGIIKDALINAPAETGLEFT